MDYLVKFVDTFVFEFVLTNCVRVIMVDTYDLFKKLSNGAKYKKSSISKEIEVRVEDEMNTFKRFNVCTLNPVYKFVYRLVV